MSASINSIQPRKSSRKVNLSDVIACAPGFSKWSHADRIRFLAWFLHYYRKRERFSSSDIAKCYEELSMAQPSGISPFLAGMEKKRPK